MKKLLLFFSFFIPSWTQTAQCTIFAHGIVDGPMQIQRFQEAIATPQMIALQFPDAQPASGWGFNGALGLVAKLLGKNVNRNAMFMGQEADIETILKAVTQVQPENSIVLYGCSRGGAALLTYLATHNPTNIAALVLDACPASIPDILHSKLAQFGIAPSIAIRIFTSMFPRYNPETAITPEIAITTIQNKNLPILLIHSECDNIVHHTHSLRLYRQLMQAGFTNIHLMLAPLGRHSYLLQNVSIRAKYLQTVHSFYKKYNLPHNPTWAQSNIPTSNLTMETIDQKISDYQRSIKITCQQAFNRNIIISGTLILILTYYLCQ